MKKEAVGKHGLLRRWILDPLVALVVALVLGFFCILPLPVARKVGRGLGDIVGRLMRQRNRWAFFNLTRAFPEKTTIEKKEIIKKMWAHFGQVAAELPHEKQVVQHIQFHHLEYLQKAYADGRGGFICSAHLGNWEVPFGQAVAPDFVPNPVYRKANNFWLDKLLFNRRVGTKIPKGMAGARVMLDLLKKGQFITILCDQKFREGQEVPLFGYPAQTAMAMASLAIKKNLPIIMGRNIFKNGCYHIEFLPPLPLPKNKNLMQAEYQLMCQVNAIYEQWFRQTPEQYLWIHRRYDKHLYVDA